MRREPRCRLKSTSCPIAETNEDTARLADLIEGVAGELSPFELLHGYSIDGVDLETCWCLDKEDLCVAKLCALREKDQNFVAALLDAGLVDSDLIATRLNSVPDRFEANAARATDWLRSRSR